MSDRFEDWLRNHGATRGALGEPAAGTFDANVRPQVEQALQAAVGTRAPRRGRRSGALWAGVAAVVLAAGVAGTIDMRSNESAHPASSTHPDHGTQTTVNPSKFPVFHAPVHERLTYDVPSPALNAKVLVYEKGINGQKPGSAPGSASGWAYVVAPMNGQQVVLASFHMMEGVWITPRWMDGDYAVVAASETPGDWTGLVLKAYQISQVGGGWHVSQAIDRDLNHGPVLDGAVAQVGNQLVVRSSILGGPTPTVYRFDRAGLSVQTSDKSVPSPGHYPSAVLYTLSAQRQSVGGSEPGQTQQIVTVSANATPIHLKVGDLFIIEEHPMGRSSTTAPVPLGVYWQGIPADAVALQPSPYRDALIYRVKHPFRGTLTWAAHVAGPNDFTMKGLEQVEVIAKK